MKNLTNLNITPFTNEEVMKLIKLYQFKGKDFYYQNVMSADLESIIKQTVEVDCYEMAKYLNLDNNTWKHPCTGEEFSYSFFDLYDMGF